MYSTLMVKRRPSGCSSLPQHSENKTAKQRKQDSKTEKTRQQNSENKTPTSYTGAAYEQNSDNMRRGAPACRKTAKTR